MITGEVEEKLHAYLGGIIREMDGTALCINGTSDHVHLLVRTPKTLADAEFMRTLKSNSTGWLKKTFESKNKFAWQEGYGWFSIGPSAIPKVTEYIRNQKEHHRKVSFQEEFVRFLEKYEIEYDERYLWD